MPEVLGRAPVLRAGRGCAVPETGVAGSGRLQGVDALPGGGQVGGPGPAGWDFQDLLAGVGDEAGGSGEDPVAQHLGFGFGEGRLRTRCGVARRAG
jgi:hypothetical protein